MMFLLLVAALCVVDLGFALASHAFRAMRPLATAAIR